MNSQTITLGDGRVLLITYDDNGKVITIGGTNPVFLFLFGQDQQITIGQFINNTFGTITELMEFIGDLLG